MPAIRSWAMSRVDSTSAMNRPGVPRTSHPTRHVLLPNQFELGLLTGCSIQTTCEAIDAAHGLLAYYPVLQIVVIKGIRIADALHLVTVSREQLTRMQHPAVDYRLSGTGDAFSAAWLGLYLRTRSLQQSLTYAGSSSTGWCDARRKSSSASYNCCRSCPGCNGRSCAWRSGASAC